MYSAKRKVQNILHNATNPTRPAPVDRPSTPSASAGSLTSTIDEIARKRPRISDVTRPVRPGTASSTATKTSPKPIKVDAATYAPWDRQQFLNRLGTYRSISNWSMKPEPVNEVAWAKRGWVCMPGQKDRVRCTSHCGGEVVVKIEVEEDEESDEEGGDKLEAIVKKYEELLVVGHVEDCMWRRRGCDPAIYRLTLQPPAVSRADFYTRYKSLSTFAANTIPTNLDKPADLDVSTFILPADIGNESEGALTLAVCGWTREDAAGAVDMLKCDACFRRLGLWLFNKAPSVEPDVEDDESSIGRLDTIQEHRDYCPWINAASQTGTKPGWQILAKVLSNPIPGNLVAAATPIRPHTPVTYEPKTEEQHRADDETRWQRLKSLRKSYGPNFGMRALAGKAGLKKKGGSPAPSVGIPESPNPSVGQAGV